MRKRDHGEGLFRGYNPGGREEMQGRLFGLTYIALRVVVLCLVLSAAKEHVKGPGFQGWRRFIHLHGAAFGAMQASFSMT